MRRNRGDRCVRATARREERRKSMQESKEQSSPSVVGARSVDIVVSVMILTLAVLLGWDSWRTGASWAADGPQAGYFPFYLSILMGGASFYGLLRALFAASGAAPLSSFRQFGGALFAYLPAILFCAVMVAFGL